MIFSHTHKQNVDEHIIELLHTKERSGPSLLIELQKRSPISKETFYRILRTLLREEVINKQHTLYQLNRHWLQKIYRFSKKHIEINQEDNDNNTDSILSFKEGDTIKYTFKNPNLMGIYWAHTYDLIFENHDPQIPILIFHPHEWLIHARRQSESFFLNRFHEDKKLVFFLIGGNTEIDKQFKKEWRNTYRQVNTGSAYGLKKTEYLNVLGDFIFKVSVSKKFSDDLDTFFATHKKITPENSLVLEQLCARKDRTTMIFMRSKKEAEKWMKKFKKDFYIP